MTRRPRVRVLAVGPETEIRRWTFDLRADLEVVAIARDREEATALARRYAPDVVIVSREELYRFADDLQQTRERLRRNEEGKSGFLLALSHELRTPLTAVLGMAQTLERHLDRLDAEQARELAGRLLRGARQLHQTVTSLEHVERASAEPWAGRREAIDLVAHTRRVVASAQLHGHHVHVEDGAFDAYVNPVHFELIVLHLVRNVVKHTPEGTRAWVRFRSRPEGVEVAVDDDGPGVPEDAKASIFEPFEQSAAPKHAPGMGIGLTVVSYLAAAAGGRAWAEDRPGGGASFRVLLPQRVSARRAANV